MNNIANRVLKKCLSRDKWSKGKQVPSKTYFENDEDFDRCPIHGCRMRGDICPKCEV